jgi:chemosensory pili system protein ChpE
VNPLIVTGVVIAIGYALVPGPVNAETTRRGIRDGFGPAIGVQLGALAGDVPWAVLCLTGVAPLLQGTLLSTMLGLVGAGFLILLARSAFRSALSGETLVTTACHGTAWRVGLTLSLANPGAIAFWTGVGGGALAASQEGGTAGVWMLVASYTLASVLAGALLSAMATLGQRWTRGTAMRWVDGFCGLTLAAAGVGLLWGTV